MHASGSPGEHIVPSLESGAVEVTLELPLPPGPAQALQDAVGKIRELQVGVALQADQGTVAHVLGGDDDQSLPPPADQTQPHRSDFM